MRSTNQESTVCRECGTTTASWKEERIVNGSLHFVPCKRDYYPITFSMRLKPDTATTYIVTPETEAMLKRQAFSRIRSTDAGKLNYAVDVPLPRDGSIGRILDSDERVEEWHTETSAPVCDSHIHFVDKRW
jgi:hypothetical protein